MEKPDIVICEWPASLYLDKKRRWMYGNLAIHSDSVAFTSDNNSTVKIPFDDFIDVKKSTTGLVFGAVYIVKRNNEKVWISSLADREGVYGALRHFWRSQLIPEEHDRTVPADGRTERGTKLLSILKDSESTLSKAAAQLQSQGMQIDNSLSLMSDIHNDLDIADHLVEDIDSWFGAWRMPSQQIHINPVIVNKSDIPEIFEYEVIYTKLETGRANSRQVGALRISKDGMTLLTEKQRTTHHFRWSDISQIRVVTPYEIMLIRFQIGKPDLTYSVVSACMVAILKLLEKCVRYKLTFDKPPEAVLCTRHKPPAHTGSQKTVKSSDQPWITNLKAQVPAQSSVQFNQSAQIVSDAEADEISRTISGLKSLAVAVQQEGASQNEKLDDLKQTVESANARLTSTDKRIKRMI